MQGSSIYGCDKWMGSVANPYDRTHLGDESPPRVIETMWGKFEEPDCIEPTKRCATTNAVLQFYKFTNFYFTVVLL